MKYLGMMVMAYPKKADKTCITARAAIAPINTVHLGCLIAMIAAIKKVLSPSSETKITLSVAMKPWTKLPDAPIYPIETDFSCDASM